MEKFIYIIYYFYYKIDLDIKLVVVFFDVIFNRSRVGEDLSIIIEYCMIGWVNGVIKFLVLGRIFIIY